MEIKIEILDDNSVRFTSDGFLDREIIQGSFFESENVETDWSSVKEVIKGTDLSVPTNENHIFIHVIKNEKHCMLGFRYISKGI